MYLLLSLFNIGDIFLVKEYLVAMRISDIKVVILAVNTFLLKYSFVLLIFP